MAREIQDRHGEKPFQQGIQALFELRIVPCTGVMSGFQLHPAAICHKKILRPRSTVSLVIRNGYHLDGNTNRLAPWQGILITPEHAIRVRQTHLQSRPPQSLFQSPFAPEHHDPRLWKATTAVAHRLAFWRGTIPHGHLLSKLLILFILNDALRFGIHPVAPSSQRRSILKESTKSSLQSNLRPDGSPGEPGPGKGNFESTRCEKGSLLQLAEEQAQLTSVDETRRRQSKDTLRSFLERP
ncbi:hypothetical protein AC578_3810 [Pseudocercospora eumusae]|uniref:Uncharacterized protein n=1 Tax=Pseudocercospora eumusae TaxID=321146 RepID=A0A139HFH1_9PEZI|nr:hypothetical protein AC578_3810 [Pseudocercospora eumusae]